MKICLGKFLFYIGVSIPLVVFLSFSSWAESSGSSSTTLDEAERRMQNEIKTVDLSYGVSEEEARVIASAYFGNYVSGCGSIFEVKDQGEYWAVSTLVGFGAEPGEDIFVDKTSGRTTSKGFPDFSPKKPEKPIEFQPDSK